jgi:hypothetical protein
VFVLAFKKGYIKIETIDEDSLEGAAEQKNLTETHMTTIP